MCAVLCMMLPGLPDADAEDLTRGLYTQLEERVGERLASAMCDAQMSELEELIDA